ncbi:MAG: FAD-dependent oxidoreductase [Chloroflexi bacterium]|nr:FAD-dependent oxidoreductase [Chloroflexota bacterium]
MKIVIIGGVAAGMSAATRLRRLDEHAEIVVLERGEYVSYANCGLPYHIAGTIAEREKLLVASPEYLRQTFNLDLRLQHEVIAIDPQQKTVTIKTPQQPTPIQERYDKLLIAVGSQALQLPIPGSDLPQIHTVRTIPDVDQINQLLADGARHAVVIGAGYIGLEMIEALQQRGLTVELVELAKQVLPLFDHEMVSEVADLLQQHGVKLHLGASAQRFVPTNQQIAVHLSDGRQIKTDLVIMAVGVRPSSQLAQAAGLTLGERGGIAVNQYLQTSDSAIYAAGDVIEVQDTVLQQPALIALAGPANRQGRIVAEHMLGRSSRYHSSQGTAIVKVHTTTCAMTGASEKSLQRAQRAYHKIYLHPNDHAGYYPDAQQMHLKLLFAPADGRILGAQIVGGAGVDKRIDVLATAIRAKMSVHDLTELELAYAPPYGSAKDPINMAGFLASNLLDGTVKFWYAEEYPAITEHALIVDVRNPDEYAAWHIPQAINLPLAELRAAIPSLKAQAEGRPIRLHCMVGMRSYIAYRILRQSGFANVATLAGGALTLKAFGH